MTIEYVLEIENDSDDSGDGIKMEDIMVDYDKLRVSREYIPEESKDSRIRRKLEKKYLRGKK